MNHAEKEIIDRLDALRDRLSSVNRKDEAETVGIALGCLTVYFTSHRPPDDYGSLDLGNTAAYWWTYR